MSSNSKHKDEAWEFIKYASTDVDVQTSMDICGIPAALSVTEADDYLTTFPEGIKPYNKTVVQKMEDAVIWPTDVGVWGKMVKEIQAKYDLVMNREATVDEVVEQLQSTGDAELAKSAN